MRFPFKVLALVLSAIGGSILLGALAVAGGYYSLNPTLPSTANLKEVHLQVPLRIYSRDGKLLAEYGEMRRTPLKYRDIPPLMVQAVLAAEDDRFFHHPGIDYQGMARAAVNLALTGEKSQGGSTITMQVARNFFLSSEKTYARKLNEMLLALKIERELTKEEILELYLNKIYLGNHAYGVGAAAQIYYGHELKDLNLAQMAMIAGLPKAPSKYNPIADPARALARRNYILERMRKLGYINDTAYRQAVAVRDTARLHSSAVETDAPYAGEMVRAALAGQFGEALYTHGYRVYTTIDSGAQRAANTAERLALADYDRRHGYRGPEGHVDMSRPTPWTQIRAAPVTDYWPAVIMRVETQSATARLASGYEFSLPWTGLSWARTYIDENRLGPTPRTAGEILKAGDIVRVERLRDDGWRLAQIPAVQGALVALNPEDGAITALVGGADFTRSKFNRVTQASRQPGSSFKPLLYSAALAQGYTPASIINDAPILLQGADAGEDWRPENYDGDFSGPTRLREALTRSLNMVSIRLLQGVGVDYTIDYVSTRFAIPRTALPPNLSLALGSGTLTPLQLARAYAVFANGGYRVDPYLIARVENATGKVVMQAYPARVCRTCEQAPADGTMPAASQGKTAPRVITAANAYLMTSMLQDVIRHGTARGAMRLGRMDIAGKTGTTNDHRDAWFSGFNADTVVAAWVGYDDMRPLGRDETGGHTALPMWTTYMGAVLKGVPEHTLDRPEEVVSVRINPVTGLPAAPGDPDAIFEIFAADAQPRPEQSSPGGDAGRVPLPEQLF